MNKEELQKTYNWLTNKKNDIDFIRNETVDHYFEDKKWNKSFKKNGPLEWFNPISSIDNNFVNAGTEEDWLEEARIQYLEKVLILPLI